jgi:hypothetical protein
MREMYPAAVAQLIDLFQRAAECDRECSKINGSAPYGEHRRLLKVELAARRTATGSARSARPPRRVPRMIARFNAAARRGGQYDDYSRHARAMSAIGEGRHSSV